jgi:predicted aspartyl protease
MMSKLGLALMIALAVVGPGVTAPAAGDAAGPPRRPAGPERIELPRSVRVPVARIGHQIGVQARVNGKGPFRFVIDTGSAASLRVSPRLASALHLETIGTALMSDPSGRNPKPVRLVRVGSVGIGAARFSGIEASVGTRLGPAEPAGIIGLPLFSRLTVTLDYPGGELELSRRPLPPGGAHVVDFTLDRGVPQIGVKAAGVRLRVDVDSGSPAFLTVPSSAMVPLSGKPKVVGKGRSAGGEFQIRAAGLSGDFSIAGWSHTRPSIHIVDAFPAASIGSQLLSGYRVTFDLRNRRSAFTR